jgi:hypothetical protein
MFRMMKSDSGPTRPDPPGTKKIIVIGFFVCCALIIFGCGINQTIAIRPHSFLEAFGGFCELVGFMGIVPFAGSSFIIILEAVMNYRDKRKKDKDFPRAKVL